MARKAHWIGIAVTLLVALSLTYLAIMWHLRRPGPSQSYALQGQMAREANVRLAFTLGNMTRVQSEAGIAVGILDAFYKEDVRDLFPGVEDYDRDRDAILWCYGCEPVVVHTPEGVVAVIGSDTNNLLWYCKVPRALADTMHCIMASTNEADRGNAPRESADE